MIRFRPLSEGFEFWVSVISTPVMCLIPDYAAAAIVHRFLCHLDAPIEHNGSLEKRQQAQSLVRGLT